MTTADSPLSFPVLAGYLLVLVRCAALCSVAPLLGLRAVPGRVRLGVALAISTAVFGAAGGPRFAAWSDTGTLMLAVASETVLGLATGLAARMAIEAAGAAGHAMGLSMGLGFGAVLDPLHGAESTAISEILVFLALGAAVAAGIHREAIAWLCRSAITTPPGTLIDLRELCAGVVAETARGFALAVRLAFPVMAAVTFGHVALGLVTRAVPQLNMANIGFTVAILCGGGAFYLVAPDAADLAAHAARAVFTR